jgi:hypothetical protein
MDDLDAKSPDELELLAAKYRQAAADAEHLRILKLQREYENVIQLRRRNDAYAIEQMKVSALADPEKRLRDVVREVRRFTDSLEVIVQTAVNWAESCGFGEDIFRPIITEAVRNLPRPGARNAG